MLITASILGFLGVMLGAFAAHGLKAVLTEAQITSFQTGVRYQFYHTFLLLAVANTSLVADVFKKRIYWLLLIGVIFFSGSIYILSLDEYILGSNIKGIAMFTPLGGLLLLGAWLLLFMGVIKKRN